MLTISQSQLTEDRESTLRFSLRNESAGSLKLSVDLSGNDFLEIKDPVIEFPIIGREQEATRSQGKSNLTGAYKYASDFVKLDLVGDDLKRDFEDLANQFKLRLEERLNIPLELVEKTDVLVHRVMTGR